MSTSITINEAAYLLNISQQRVRTLCRSGILTSKKFGRSWMLDENSVRHYGLRTAHTVAEDHPSYDARNNINKKPIALSFFSGAMGLDIGIERAGFDIRLACEIDKYCRQTIAINKPKMALLSNINNYSKQDILKAACLNESEEIDLIVGGPPCQAFSTAGKRKAFKDDRGNVFLKYIDLAIELRPKYIVIENVRGLLSCPLDHRPHEERGIDFPDLSADEMKGGALNFILSKLKKSGYTYSFNLYNSANFGTPQIRERIIIICSKDGKVPPYLSPTHSQNNEFSLPKWKVFKQAVKGLNEHHHINFPEKRLRYYRMLKPGENWKKLPEKLQKEALGKSFYAGGGKTGFLRRLDWNKPSPTLVTHPAMPATDLAHPVEDRPLSIQEYKRIQEFPDNWELAGPLIQQYKQVGNAVPTSLGFAVGNLIKDLLNKEKIKQINGFCYSRYRNTSHHEWERQFLDAYNKSTQSGTIQNEIQLS
ncbi:MAG: DNA cytosine methyltransferase [Gammaproteobacteria bacterium]|nr:DNA cytosine methyltransferase [Gammaproteobacteria bacterium]